MPFVVRFRSIKQKQEDWKVVVERFKEDQDYMKAYRGLTAGDALRTFFLDQNLRHNRMCLETM